MVRLYCCAGLGWDLTSACHSGALSKRCAKPLRVDHAIDADRFIGRAQQGRGVGTREWQAIAAISPPDVLAADRQH